MPMQNAVLLKAKTDNFVVDFYVLLILTINIDCGGSNVYIQSMF